MPSEYPEIPVEHPDARPTCLLVVLMFVFIGLTFYVANSVSPPAAKPVPLVTEAVEAEKATALPIVVHFSPNGGCTDEIVRQIGATKHTIHIQAYSFTSEPIASALIAAHKRGVEVFLLADKSDSSGSSEPCLKKLQSAGVSILTDARHAIAHNKIMVFDCERVATGSFNFTDAAEAHNAENSLVITDKFLAAAYEANWQAHKSHCVPFSPK